jgi:hypothetical protein
MLASVENRQKHGQLTEKRRFDILPYPSISFRQKRQYFQGFSMSKESEKRVKLLHTVSEGMKDWLESEKKRTGRSVSFMVELSLKQWRDRIERGRKND